VSDSGGSDVRLAAALALHTASPGISTRAEVLAALVGARVFVAITANSTAEHVDDGTGLPAGSCTEMALLTLVGSAGGRAVPLFLDAGSAVAFREGARPVPLRAPEACGAALDDGAVAVLVDPPGAALVVRGAELVELAAGRVPIAGTGLSSRRADAELEPAIDVDPTLVNALGVALHNEKAGPARLLRGPAGLVLAVEGPLSPAALASLAARLLPAVREVLPPGGLDLSVGTGAGLEIPVRGRRLRRWLPGRGPLRRDR